MIGDLLSLDYSLQIVGVAAIVWAVQKIIDNFADHFFNKKIFYPLYKKALRNYKIYKTKADPVRATFSVSYTPDYDLTIASATEKLERAFQQAQQASSGKITINDDYWSETERRGKVEVYYSDQTELFNIDVELVRDPDSVRSNPSGDPDSVQVGSIGLEIHFNFPFNLLEDTLFNLGSLISYLEDGFQDQIRGGFSGGRFIISPVNTDLTIDEWVEDEKFDISLLLATEDDDRTEVEFFSDRAIIKSNQREIDAKTVKYMRELLLNYYL